MNIEALFDMSYGVYFASTQVDGEKVGCIANTIFQVTATPVRIGVSINKDNYSEDFFRRSGHFTVSIASEETTMDSIGRFGFYSGRDIDKFEATKHFLVGDGYPVVDDKICAWLLCKIESEIDCGTHTIFIGELIDAERLEKLPPMTYAYYHKIKGGTTAKNAPTYIETEEKEEKTAYVCDICGYVFEGTEEEFENLPDDWKCPLCKMDKSHFKKNRQ